MDSEVLLTGPLERARLVRHLEEQVSTHALTVIAAGPAWGKTTLLDQWGARQGERVLRVAFEPGSPPAEVWRRALGLAGTSDPASPADWRSVPQALAHREPPWVIVLEDLDHVRDAELVSDVVHLAAETPAHLRLIVTSRSHRGLPLAGLRARGRVATIRPHRLRFDPAEADAVVRSHGLDPDRGPAADHMPRLRGWPGLYALLATVSVDDGVTAPRLTGQHRYVLDWVGSEILPGLDPPAREFLLDTAVLDRICVSLADAVTGRADALTTLDSLDRDNELLEPQDKHGIWWSIPPVLRESLERLALLEGRDVRGAHRRAADWLLRHRLREQAISHLIACEDWPRACAEILDGYWTAISDGRIGTVLSWFARIPSHVMDGDARLFIALASALLLSDRLDDVETMLRRASAAPVDGPFSDGLPSREAGLALGEATVSLMRGDLGRARDSALTARSLMTPEQAVQYANVVVVIAGAAFYETRAQDARLLLRRAVSLAESASSPVAGAAAAALIARMYAETGDLGVAAEHCLRAERLMSRSRAAAPSARRMLLMARATLAHRRGLLHEAAAAYEKVHTLSIAAGDRLSAVDAAVCRAVVELHRSDRASATSWLERSEQEFESCPDPGVRLTDLVARTRRLAAGEPSARPSGLTVRQESVMHLVEAGMTDAQIALRLSISERTVHAHLRAIYSKLGVRSRSTAVDAYRLLTTA
ncbi:LuxR C-terminal-related transcriptional regulator [Streptosporangium sp. NPDC002544]|uniref:LuxR C-terminal-related transcriptional regulator n=1 Tax=Streptosporangium sp. NPDC002544 TaxID=3154538 RepID=UPI00331B64B3